MIKPSIIFAAMLASTSPVIAEVVGINIARMASEVEMKASLSQIELEDETGARTALRDLMGNGKPTLITLWAHWCGNCRAEMADYKVIASTCPERWNIIFISSRARDFTKDIVKYRSFGVPWKFYKVVEAPNANEGLRQAFYGATKNGEVITPLHYLVTAGGRVDAIVNARMNFAEPSKLAAFCQ